MKVTYEFNLVEQNDDFYTHQVYERAHSMFQALVDIEDYVGGIANGFDDDDKEKISEKILDIIYESKIREIE